METFITPEACFEEEACGKESQVTSRQGHACPVTLAFSVHGASVSAALSGDVALAS